MGGYTRAVSGQRLGKHVPFARQQILNNATVGLQQWKSYVFYVVRTEMLLYMAFKLPYIYNYTIKLYRKQAEVIQNNEDSNLRNIGQAEPRHRKY
jgi:hypothetical protein